MVRALPPHPDLADCVAWYWSVEATQSAPVDLRVDVYVDARADLVFNLGAPYHRTRLGHPRGMDGDPCYTEPMAKLTLVIDDDLLQRARRRALEQGTSVKAVVREMLANYADDDRVLDGR